MGQESLLTADAVVQEHNYVSMGESQYLLSPTFEVSPSLSRVSTTSKSSDDMQNIKTADTWPGHTHPIVIIATWRNDRITRTQLQSLLTDIFIPDDIFQPGFLANVIFYGAREDELVLDPEASKLLEEWGTSNIEYIANDAFQVQLAQGPYMIHRGRLWQPWRIYDDHAETLMMSFMPFDLGQRKYDIRPSRPCNRYGS